MNLKLYWENIIEYFEEDRVSNKGVKSPFDAYVSLLIIAYGQTVKDRISGCLVPCDEPW
jgi:hypothetical protein